MKKVTLRFAIIMFLCLIGCSTIQVPPVDAGQAILSWVAPTTNEDGTPLTDLKGYKLYYGTVSGTYTKNIDVGNVLTYTISNLVDGTYFFVGTAYNVAGTESKYSNEISKVVKNVPKSQSGMSAK